jgi:outer membrane protein assembly factor BamB
MTFVRSRVPAFAFVFFALFIPWAIADDWPHWGGADGRNMVYGGKASLPAIFDPGVTADGGLAVDMTTTKNVKWAARLGTRTFGNPTVSGGKVFIGTNNGARRNRAYNTNRGVLMCFDEANGEFLWQLAVPKLREIGNFNGDSGDYGICSSPTVEGDRVYVVTNCCEVLCLRANGLADGNHGPFTDEARYLYPYARTKPGKGPRPATEPPIPDRLPPPGPTDADILWKYDMIAELDVWPEDASNCSVLLIGDLLYVCTSNGVDSTHRNIPSPQAPSVIVLDKNTGKLVAVDDANVGPKIFHGLWSNPSTGVVQGKQLVFWGGGDGFCYAFDAGVAQPPPAFRKNGTRTGFLLPEKCTRPYFPGMPRAPVPHDDGKPGTLKTVWKFNCNPPDRLFKDGKPLPYRHREGPSEIIGTPAFVDGRVYVTTGQDPRHGHGVGTLSCIDAAAGKGDITAAGKVWQYEDMERSFATPAVAGGLVYVSDLNGTLHCVDAATGRRVWTHDTGSPTWASAFVADGKVFIGNEKGVLTVLAAGREKKVLSEVRLPAGIVCTPIVANGVLYVACQTFLYAVQGN